MYESLWKLSSQKKFLFCLQKSYTVKLISICMISLDYLQFILKPQMKRKVSKTD